MEYMHYKPYPLKSVPGKKSLGTYAFSIGNFDFFILQFMGSTFGS
jgi:hypothetical protein